MIIIILLKNLFGKTSQLIIKCENQRGTITVETKAD
jgi:hypothetical protein